MNDKTLAATVNTSQGNYRILVGSGIIDNITDELAKCNLTGRVFLVADRALPESSIRALRQKLGNNYFGFSLKGIGFQIYDESSYGYAADFGFTKMFGFCIFPKTNVFLEFLL